jgi:DNA-binding MarR family transcriptional regulator
MSHYLLLREIYDTARSLLLSTESIARRYRVLESLTAEDERILRRVYTGAVTIPALAYQAGQSPKQVGTVVRRLVSRGFLARRYHGRQYRVELTLAGRTVAHISMRRAAGFASWLSEGLDSEDLAVTAQTLRRIVHLTRRYSQREDSHYP